MSSAAPSEAPAPPRPAWLRYAWIAVAVVAVAGVLIFVFWDKLAVWRAINALSTPSTRKPNEEILQKSTYSGTNEMLEDTLRDDKKTFGVREAVARVLWKRQRLPVLEAVLRGGSPGARRAVVSALAGQDFFVRDYLQDESYGVRKTIMDWLADPKDANRAHALQVALDLPIKLDSVLPVLRTMLVRRPVGDLPPTEERAMLMAAGEGLIRRLKDCESLPVVEALAKSDKDPIVRRHALMLLFDGAVGEGAAEPCRESFPPERVKALVLAALDDPDRAIRQGALSVLDRPKIAWAAEARDKLFAILDGPHDTVERGSALRALSAARDEGLRAELPRYVHDKDPYVRSTAVDAMHVAERETKGQAGFLTTLVGVFERETENPMAFTQALEALRTVRKDYEGLPDPIRKEGVGRSPKFQAFLKEMFAAGASQGVDRVAWAKAWWLWAAQKLGVPSEDEANQLYVQRETIWKALKAVDAAAARAALDAVPSKIPGLFLYEEAWLRSIS